MYFTLVLKIDDDLHQVAAGFKFSKIHFLKDEALLLTILDHLQYVGKLPNCNIYIYDETF